MAKTELPTRQRILQAAEPLFAKQGFSGVSMRSIAAAAGVHLGQLPYHFGTKEALYREIWEFWFSQIEADALLSEMRPHADASQKGRLRSVVEAFFDGPGRILRDSRGRYFVAIMVKEANDPTASERSLLEEFIYPNGNRFRSELARLFPDMDAISRDVGFEMIIAGLRIVIERGSATADGQITPSEATHLFGILTQFIVEGWMALVTPA
jgi:TetR/AcrR family transcriptional regulator, regulator of cefoperazone and chloramphenicol sensitivity